MKKILLGMLCVSIWALPACSGEEKDSAEQAEEQNEQMLDSRKAEGDAEFAVKAASGGMMEVELGKLALANASSGQVKEFGQAMIDEHSAANSELQQLAQQKGVALPSAPAEDHQEKINELSAKRGGEFDRAYIDFMVEDHKEDIELFQDAANHSHDEDLKLWFSGKITVLRHHLSMAENLKESMDSRTK